MFRYVLNVQPTFQLYPQFWLNAHVAIFFAYVSFFCLTWLRGIMTGHSYFFFHLGIDFLFLVLFRNTLILLHHHHQHTKMFIIIISSFSQHTNFASSVHQLGETKIWISNLSQIPNFNFRFLRFKPIPKWIPKRLEHRENDRHSGFGRLRRGKRRRRKNRCRRTEWDEIWVVLKMQNRCGF